MNRTDAIVVRMSDRVRLFLACSLFVILATSGALGSERLPGDPLLVGVQFGRAEVGTMEIRLDEQGYLIPLVDFAEMAGCSLFESGGSVQLTTPLGGATFEETELFRHDDTILVREGTMERRLALSMRFDSAAYAVRFDLPWNHDRDGSGAGYREEIEPDFEAPRASLSTVNTDVRYTEFDGSGKYDAMTTLAGRLGPGFWRFRYEDDLDSQHTLRDYAWTYQRDHHLLLAGHQRVRVHPLLASLEFTGVQMAYTNRQLEPTSRTLEFRELLSRRIQPLGRFDGYGPPAGYAELRVNDVTVERRRIGLDGHYEFVDVSIPGRQASRVEILLYDRHDLRIPVEVVERTTRASEYLLPAGTALQLGGAGAGGNAIQQQFDDRPGRGSAGFYQMRYGVAESTTVETAVQYVDGSMQAVGGVVSRWGKHLVTALSAGASDGSMGYSVDLEGLPHPWRLFLHSRAFEAGFDPTFPGRLSDHSMELGYAIRPGLDVGLMARSRRSPTTRVSYALPALTWRATPKLVLWSRPDPLGDYRIDLQYRVLPTTRLHVGSVADRLRAGAWHRFTRNLIGSVDTEFGGRQSDRHKLLLNGRVGLKHRMNWSAGALWNAGELGYLVAGGIEIAAGIRANARYEVGHWDAFEEGRSSRLLVNISADLAYSRGRLVPANTGTIRADRGGIAGAVRIEGLERTGRYDLHDVPIKMNGRVVGRTDSRGTYYLGDLPPGVHRLELDSGELPIELAIQRRYLQVEVVGAAVTRADFVVRPEFGLAGRLRDTDGVPVAGYPIALVDSQGNVFQSTRTDRFGLYRMDAIPRGVYVLLPQLRDCARAIEETTRPLQIDDDFLFGQDLVIGLEGCVDPSDLVDRIDSPATPSS